MDAVAARSAKWEAFPVAQPKNPDPVLDDVDSALVKLLQNDARMPNSRLAAAAGIAESTCISRVRSLVARGVITGFSATVAPKEVGFTLQALISVSIRAGARARIVAFSDEIRALPGVVQVFFLGSSEDFIIHLVARDSDAVREFVVENLSVHEAVATTRTSLVFEHHYNGVTVA
jgi:DNA-binding Lrp family transcriptional regulator